MRPLLVVVALVAATACGAQAAPPLLTTTVAAGASVDLPVGDVVAVDGVRLATPDSLAPADPTLASLAAAVRDAGQESLLVMSNDVPDLGEPSGDLARAMLADAGARAAVVDAVVSAADGFDGVQVLLSGLASPDSVALVDFVTELDEALPDGAVLTLGMVASTDFGGYRERGYDVEALEPVVDRFVLQSFEAGGSALAPEPIGDAARVEQEVDYLTSQVDAERIDLGITPSLGLSPADADVIATAAGLHGVVVGTP